MFTDCLLFPQDQKVYPKLLMKTGFFVKENYVKEIYDALISLYDTNYVYDSTCCAKRAQKSSYFCHCKTIL